MNSANEPNVSDSTTSKALRTAEIMRELTDDEIASVVGGLSVKPPIVGVPRPYSPHA